jgi:putative peptidoglycan lipid II flippase
MVDLGARIRQEEADVNSDPTPAPEPPGGIPRRAQSVGAAIGISRILGLAREMVLARTFGAGSFTDAFYIAYRIPNMLRDLFAEGALSAALVPTLIRRMTQGGREEGWVLVNRLVSTLLLVLGAVTLGIYFGSRGLVWMLAAGFRDNPAKFELTAQMTRIMSPFLLSVSLASVGMAALNACGRFFLPALASSLFNICCILAALLLSDLMPGWGFDPIVSMAVGAVLGGAAQFLVMIPPAGALGYRFRLDFRFSDPDLRAIGRLALPAVLGLSATQISIVVDSQLASLYGDGPVSWLSYGFRLMQLPIGLIGVAVATATMTTVSEYAALGMRDRIGPALGSGLRLSACLIFPAMVGLLLFRGEIVQLLFQRGAFLEADTLWTGRIVGLYTLGLFAYSAVKILTPAFYALNNTRTPLRASLSAVAAKILLSFLLIQPLGFLGLPLATSLSSWLQFALLRRPLARSLSPATAAHGKGAYLRIALASLMMGAIALAVHRGAEMMLPGPGALSLLFRLGAAIMAALAAIVPLLWLFRVEEARELARLAGIFRRKGR